ncbi:ABC transporter permease [Marinoscillum pacificum]|uniref:ABC transporter permease n=1 Tax=Marinoscillum pacificum TaxID=392723 RepID=UPI0021579C23|nr:ABC transporter permease [Marinoscillum pacificum]
MYFKLAWRNIWRNKRRSLITIGSITFAVLLACSMRSMQLGSYDRMVETAVRFYTGYIQIHKDGYWADQSIDNSFEYNQGVIDQVASANGVEEVVPRVESFALASFAQKTKGGMVVGIDPGKENALTEYQDKLIEGEDLLQSDQAALISEGLAKYLKIKVGDSLVLISQGYHGANAAAIYPIKGIMKFPSPAQNDGTIFIPIKEAQWFYAMEGRLTSLSLVIDEAKRTDQIVADISSKINNDDLEVMGWKDLLPDLVQSIEIDSISGQIMIWILYAVIGFGMFGTFLMMTAERMYEFGVMMSIGMKRIVMQFTVFLEMLMMSSMGVLVGIGISLPFLIYSYYHPIYFTGESAEAIEKFGVEAAYFFSLEPSLFYNQAWVIFVMALILGFYPLYVIWKLKPVKSMREAI